MTDVPKGWVAGPLRKFAPLQRGFDLPTTKVVPGDFPVVYSNGIGRFHNKAMLNGPGVVTGRSGTIGRVHFVERDYWPHNTTLWVTDFKTCAPKFVYYLLQSVGLQRFAGGSGVPTLNRNDAHAFEICVPASRQEQVRIADALAEADDLIVMLERSIAKKQAIKQGMMQELLTGRTRLPGFSGKWRMRQIGDFTHVKAGGTPSTAVSRYWGGDIRWMSSGEIHGKRITEVVGRITSEGLRESAAQLLPVGTVLMALAGQGKTRGTVAVSRVELSTNQSIAGILPSAEHDSDFLYYNLDTRYSELRGESSGEGGRGGLNLTIIKKLDVLMPEVDEQRAIASALAAIDDEIDALGRRMTKARAIKQGMMQQLLTGRVRLPAEDGA